MANMQIEKKIKTLYEDMLENTPGFKQFVEEHKNDSLEDLIKLYDLPKELLKEC